ncbi:zinc-binding dehydrogenase, partial [candidate division KSB1 bacterium]
VVEKGVYAGERIAGEINIGCGVCNFCREGLSRHCPKRKTLGIYKKDGIFAEYVTLPDEIIFRIPDEISNEEAVFIEPVAAAIEILEQVKIPPDSKTAIVGDGKLGHIVAQILKLTGCYVKVYGKNEKKLKLLENLQISTDIFSGKIDRSYDYVVECSGSTGGFGTALSLIKPRGTIILKSTIVEPLSVDTSRIVVDEITIVCSRCGRFQPAIRLMKDKLIKVDYMISAIFPLEEYKKAFAYAKKRDTLKVLFKI